MARLPGAHQAKAPSGAVAAPGYRRRVPTIHWFRRDLRLADNPSLLAAVEAARADDDTVVPLFVVDPVLWATAGAPRLAYLAASLRALDESLGGRLVVRHGRARDVVPAVMAEVGAAAVHVTAATEPYGRRRDEGLPLVATGSPYAVAPGRLTTQGGTPFQVFTPFRRAWLDHGWAGPAPRPTGSPWAHLRSDGIPGRRPRTSGSRPRARPRRCAAGRSSCATTWRTTPPTATGPTWTAPPRLSIPLKYGELHPRTLLADLPASADVVPLRAGLARVPRRRPLAPPGAAARVAAGRWCPRTPGPPARRARRVRRLGRGPHRLPDRRRRHAAAARARLDAQPRPHGRRVVPGQGPARALAARRRALHGLAGRRRRVAEPAELAVGRRAPVATRRRTSGCSTR